MRLLIVAALYLSQVSFAQANCNVYIPEREFHHDSGFSLNFNFQQLLGDKGYVEVATAEEEDHILKIEGVEVDGRFHKALARMEMGPWKAEETVTCLTQYCGLSDYARSFNKAYKKISKQIPRCQ